ncbi:trypsin-like serine protease [Amycolatopsis australiensis]|uniref:Trypsin n=1 Tax=Amycolatopsis australiensis TaxID=546364 RepID=A0A1K1LVL7_9PSEU|nr:trypsin-like serine protease [Amycolatopsis australiensis]SFW13710.1 Trypsin [Amycolatopsis australiensis]
MRAITAVSTLTVLVAGAAAPASAIVGGTNAPQTYAGIGSLQLDHNGHKDWGACSAHAFGTNGHGDTKFIALNAHCGTVMPPEAQVQAMSLQGKANFAQFRSWVENAGLADAPADPASHAGEGLKSTPVDPASYRFVYGNVNRFEGQSVGIKRFIPPKDWNWGEPDSQGRVWDVMVAELAHPIHVEGALVAPVLPWLPVRELGWGMTNPDPATWTGPIGPLLKQTDVRVTAKQQCAGAGIGAAEVCLGVAPDGGGTCAGDSGGGGVQRLGRIWVLVATASRGPEQRCGTANVYTEIWPYLGWIVKTMHTVAPDIRVETAAPDAIRSSAAQYGQPAPDAQTAYALAG